MKLKKALECCSEHEDCHNCLCKNECGDLSVVTTKALNLINRQKAEIERLHKKVEELSEVLSDSIKIKVKEIKSEAIKEFAEKFLRTVYDNHYPLISHGNSVGYGMFTIVMEQAVNETIKEMVGES